MDIEIKVLPEFKVASVMHVGAYHEIASAFEKLSRWMARNGVDLEKETMLGVYWDCPRDVPAAQRRSCACPRPRSKPDHHGYPGRDRPAPGPRTPAPPRRSLAPEDPGR